MTHENGRTQEKMKMLFSRKTLLALLALTLGFGFYACTEDEAHVKTPVEPAPADLPAEPPANDLGAGSTYQAQAIHFAFDRAELTAEAQASLNKLADHLKKSVASVQIEGHCDERGTIEYNLALGARRAESVKNYLVQLGVEGSRLTTISYGEEKPVNEAHNEAAWAQNRRAEFTISGQ